MPIHYVGNAVNNSFMLVSEIKGWPPVVANDADLDALNLWWDKVGTPTTAPTVVDVAGEAGITENYELCLKVVTDAASEGLLQRYTYADEPRIKSGRVLSALVAIWSVSSVSVTAKLLNSDATETAAAATTAASWTLIEIPNHTLAGTYVDLHITAAAAGTFFVVPIAVHIGAVPYPIAEPRPSRYVDRQTANVVNNSDPGGATFADLDLTTATSPLAWKVLLGAFYSNATTADKILAVRRNGDTQAITGYQALARATTAVGGYYHGVREYCMDDGQIVEWQTNGAAGDTESVYIDVLGYWEYA